MEVVTVILAWVVILGGAFLLRSKLSEFGLAVTGVAVLVFLVLALIGLALTDSPVLGWLSFAGVFLLVIARYALGVFGDGDA
jgi:hypothetical protein